MRSPDQIKKRVETYPWAKNVISQLIEKVEPFLNDGWVFPEPFPLNESDQPNLKQISAANSMVALTKAGQMKDGYARAKECLLGYAERYPDFEETGAGKGAGKLERISLCEAVWMLQATDLFEELSALEQLEESEKNLVRDNIFSLAIPLLKRATEGVHNIQTWRASAITSMALACGDERSFRFGQRIVHKNAHEGVLPCGLWYEVSPGYHFYVLRAFLHYVKSVRHYGRECGIEASMRAMLDAPADLLLSDGTFPLINDAGSEHAVIENGLVFEKGHGLFGGCESMLSMLIRDHGYERNNLEALLFGPDEIPDIPFRQDRISITEGLVFLRQEESEAVIKCTAPANTHDHNDRLSLNLYFPGRQIRGADLGNTSYNDPIWGGFQRRTEAHNTVMFDGKQQEIVDTQRTSKSADGGNVMVSTTHYNQVHPGILFWRKVVLGKGWCLDWTSSSSDDDHLFQWIFHVNATLLDEHDQPLVKDCGGDNLIENSFITKQRIIGKDSFVGSWAHQSGDRLAVRSTFLENLTGEVGVFESPDIPVTDMRNALLMQSRGKSFDLVTLFSLNDTELPFYELENNAIQLQVEGKGYKLDKSGDWHPLGPTDD